MARTPQAEDERQAVPFRRCALPLFLESALGILEDLGLHLDLESPRRDLWTGSHAHSRQ